MEKEIKLIRSLEIDKMTEKELEDFLPNLGMNDENLIEMPGELSEYYGKGLKFWQYPNQFSKYLKQLSKYEINSYLEIGCRWGGTFIITNEILKLKNKDVKSYACDLMPICSVLTEYKKYSDFTYIHESSFNLNKNNVSNQVDLILIDAEHSYNAVKKDLEVAKQLNAKYVVFHDITNDVCMGVNQFWNEIKNDYKHYEFIEQYDSVVGSYLGIGLIEL
jgi:cephalosporin hydroxylase